MQRLPTPKKPSLILTLIFRNNNGAISPIQVAMKSSLCGVLKRWNLEMRWLFVHLRVPVSHVLRNWYVHAFTMYLRS